MNEDLTRHLAEKNHEAWRNDPANGKSKYNVPFDRLPEDKQESALSDVRTIIEEYEKTMLPPVSPQPQAEAVPARKPLPAKGPLAAAIEKVLPPRKDPAQNPALTEPQPEAEDSTQTPTTTPPAAPNHSVRIDQALVFIAEELNSMRDENERRSLAGAALQSVAFNASAGDFHLATGLLERAKTDLPFFFQAVQRRTVKA